MNFLKNLFGSREEGKVEGSEVGPAPSPPEKPQPVTITEISPQQLKVRLEQENDLVVVDLRQSWEYHAGHIPGAIHIFLQQFSGRADELPRDKSIVLQCWHGFTSQDAAGFLIQNGWPASQVASLRGGMAGWVQVYGSNDLEKND